MSAIVLASASPRRRQLLGWVGVDVEVRPSDIDEAHLPGEAPVDYATRLARTKAAVAGPGRVVVAADTVVHLDGEVFGKPEDRAHGAQILGALSGRWHAVTTGVCVRRGDVEVSFAVTTRVRFRALSEAEIAAYLETGEADDKAGAYGIQGRAGAFVAEVAGSWTNVMGLPVEETLAALEEVS